VQFSQGRATVRAPTQVPTLASSVAAKALGINTDAVDVQVTALGGGFGRRLDVDFVGQAAQIAKAAEGRPVQTCWSREQDLQHDFCRPACVARFEAGLDAQGRLLGWRNTSAGQSIVHQVLGRVLGVPGVGPDKTTAEGAFDQPYEVARQPRTHRRRHRHRAGRQPVPLRHLSAHPRRHPCGGAGAGGAHGLSACRALLNAQGCGGLRPDSQTRSSAQA